MKQKKINVANIEETKNQSQRAGLASNDVTGNRKKEYIWTILMGICIIAFTTVVLITVGYLLSFDRYQLLRNGVVGCMCCLLVVFLWCQGRVTGTLLFDNVKRPIVFLMVYLIGLAFSVTFSFLPETGWVLLSFFIILALLSNPFTGLAAASTLLVCVMLFSGTTSFTVFLTYFFSGIIGIALFQEVDEEFKFGLPIFMSVLLQFVNLLANQVLFQSKSLTLQSLIFPGYNIVVNCILLFIVLPSYVNRVIFPVKNIYSIINDTEYILMQHVREISKKDFYHSIHTAYLTDRICAELDMDVPAAKTAAYYHDIGRILQEEKGEVHIMDENKFPEHAQQIILQMQNQNKEILEKETTVVIFCDNIISSLEYFADHDKEIGTQYEMIINKIIDHKIESGILNYSKISVMEMNVLRKKLLEEKLYYDFIRNNRI